MIKNRQRTTFQTAAEWRKFHAVTNAVEIFIHTFRIERCHCTYLICTTMECKNKIRHHLAHHFSAAAAVVRKSCTMAWLTFALAAIGCQIALGFSVQSSFKKVTLPVMISPLQLRQETSNLFVARHSVRTKVNGFLTDWRLSRKLAKQV